MNKRSECMIDLETLSTEPNAVILSIGAVKFDKDGLGEEFYCALDTNEQSGRHVSEQTLDWWAKQTPEARKVFDEPKTKLSTALDRFTTFLGPGVNVWGNGADFDISLLGSLYKGEQIAVPWSYGQVRCYRTFKNICKVVNLPKFPGTAHNALADAKYQAECYRLYYAAGLR